MFIHGETILSHFSLLPSLPFPLPPLLSRASNQNRRLFSVKSPQRTSIPFPLLRLQAEDHQRQHRLQLPIKAFGARDGHNLRRPSLRQLEVTYKHGVPQVTPGACWRTGRLRKLPSPLSLAPRTKGFLRWAHATIDQRLICISHGGCQLFNYRGTSVRRELSVVGPAKGRFVLSHFICVQILHLLSFWRGCFECCSQIKWSWDF